MQAVIKEFCQCYFVDFEIVVILLILKLSVNDKHWVHAFVFYALHLLNLQPHIRETC